jgi:aerobic-type carbon monoxide dehydrogenase small subunit (CoxS/CutS family)
MTDRAIELTLTLNGTERTADVDPRMLLVEALRESFGVTGPKVGCATGDCGACTVSADGAIVKSCLTLAAAAQGAHVTTIEGLGADGALTDLQQAFWDEYAFQCGFCLSGMLFAAQDLLDRNPHPTDAEIRTAISGNLCRCTGYDNIVSAVRRCSAG